MGAGKPGTVFRYRFHPGRTLVYDLSVTGTVMVETPQGPATNPIEIAMEILQTHRDSGNGSATVEVEIARARMVSGTDSAPLPEEGTRASFTQDERGVTQAQTGGATWQGSSFAGLLFPEGPLKVGEGWVQNTADPSLPGKNRTIYRYTGTKTVGTASCAVFAAEIQMDRSAMQPGSEGKSKGTVVFDPALGQVVGVDVDSAFAFLVPVPEKKIMALSRTSIRTVMKLREMR